MQFDKTLLIKNLTEQTQKQAKFIVDDVLNQVVDSLMEHSPVGRPHDWTTVIPDEDYTPGKYKANWVHSVGTPMYEYFNHEDNRDDSFQQIDCITGRLLKSHIKENKAIVATHYFTNSVPYAQDIELGSAKHNPQSLTAPHAVAGLTAQNIPGFIAKAQSRVTK